MSDVEEETIRIHTGREARDWIQAQRKSPWGYIEKTATCKPKRSLSKTHEHLDVEPPTSRTTSK